MVKDEVAAGAPREVSASNSQAVLITEIAELRRLLWEVISEGKKVAPLLNGIPQRDFLQELMRAEARLSR